MSLFFIILFCLYFVPSIVAWTRGHNNRVAITALNVLLGWSVIGWIVAMVWSLMASQNSSQRVETPTHI